MKIEYIFYNSIFNIKVHLIDSDINENSILFITMQRSFFNINKLNLNANYANLTYFSH